MKKTLIAFLIAATTLIGCKKDKSEATADKLVGKWMATSEVETEYENGKITHKDDPFNYSADQWVVEFTGTQIKQYEFGKAIEEPYNYSVSGDKITYTEDNKPKTIIIKTQTDTNLILSYEETETLNGITYREVNEVSFVKK